MNRNEIFEAQKIWGDAIIKIGSLKEDREKCVEYAREVVDKLYGYDHGEVLFKPTRAKEIPFRTTKEAALSYFVGGDSNYGEDTGFALQPWSHVSFDNAGGIVIHGEIAMAMGNYFFTEAQTGEVKQVEYTFGYFRDEAGSLRICLHHSSVPFAPTLTQ